jgi:hypothetical protein
MVVCNEAGGFFHGPFFYQNSIRSLNLMQWTEILFPFIANACAFFD